MVGISECKACAIEFRWRKRNCDKPATYCSKKCMNSMVNTWNQKNKFRWINANEEEKISKVKEKFEKYVIRKNGCWDWKGCIHKSGYVPINFYDNKQKNAHVVSWIIHNGDVPKGKLVLHKCDNRRCTNPEHLFLGSYSDNAIDREKKHRGNHTLGENRKDTKLTNDKVVQIKKLLILGVSVKRICGDYKISYGAIHAIKNGITWKHVS